MPELEFIQFVTDLGMTTLLFFLFWDERKERRALQDKIYSQLKVQSDIEKEWLVALGKLTEVLEKRGKDYERQENQLKEFADLIKRQDNEWMLSINQIREAIHEINTTVEALEQGITSNEFIQGLVKTYFDERRIKAGVSNTDGPKGTAGNS